MGAGMSLYMADISQHEEESFIKNAFYKKNKVAYTTDK